MESSAGSLFCRIVCRRFVLLNHLQEVCPVESSVGD